MDRIDKTNGIPLDNKQNHLDHLSNQSAQPHDNVADTVGEHSLDFP